MEYGKASLALSKCKKQNIVNNITNNVFNLKIDDMGLATQALEKFTTQRKDFEVTMSSLRRVHSLITVALDKIISGYSTQILPDLAQAYIITEYQYKRGILDKPCLVALIEELLNNLSIKIRQGDSNVKTYARRVRLVIDSLLVAAKRG